MAGELNVSGLLDSTDPDTCAAAGEPLADAIHGASDQDTVTWLTRDGRRIAAIVPVDLAEYAMRHPWQPPAELSAELRGRIGRWQEGLARQAADLQESIARAPLAADRPCPSCRHASPHTVLMSAAHRAQGRGCRECPGGVCRVQR